MSPQSTDSTPRTLVSRDPHDGSVVGEIATSTPDDVRHALARAREAAASWSRTPFEERAAALRSAVPALEAATEELGSLVHREMGKPLAAATNEAQRAASSIERAIDKARQALEPRVEREGDVETTVRWDPLGVVAVITPWNFPLTMPASLLYPALLLGNTVVHKPSEKVPLLGARYAKLLADALPDGVLEVLTGDGQVGREIVAGDVDMVAFVGSQATGRAIMAECSKSLKRLVLELGGKDPMIVLADADVDAAAQFAVRGAFGNSGQVCCGVERILVEDSVAPRFTEKLLELAKDFEMGPMVDEDQREKVVAQLSQARERGAKVLLGGEPDEKPGAWLPPTVITDLDDSMDITREETFGPVAAIRSVASADEALEIANRTTYGLGATVWTGDERRGEEIAERVAAGMVGINRGIFSVGDAPWVGARQSGFGHAGSIDGYRQFAQVRTITRSTG